MKPTDTQLDAALADMYSPRRPRGWYRSASGNLTRTLEGFRLTVFVRRDRLYGWCLDRGGGDPRYGREGYATEREAQQAVWEAAMVDAGYGWKLSRPHVK